MSQTYLLVSSDKQATISGVFNINDDDQLMKTSNRTDLLTIGTRGCGILGKLKDNALSKIVLGYVDHHLST